MSSMDDEWDHDIVGDLLLPWGDGSGSGDGELDHDGSTNDCEVDRIRRGSGKGTTGAAGASVVVKGDKESNGRLGDYL